MAIQDLIRAAIATWRLAEAHHRNAAVQIFDRANDEKRAAIASGVDAQEADRRWLATRDEGWKLLALAKDATARACRCRGWLRDGVADADAVKAEIESWR